MRTAVLKGLPAQPYFELEFGWGDKLPDGTKLTDWVKELPGRTWNPQEKKWRVTSAGPRPDQVLQQVGFEVDMNGYDILDIQAMIEPAARVSNVDPNKVIVLPRFAGFERTVHLLGGTPTWVKEKGWFEVGLGDLVRAGKLIGGINYNEATRAAITEWKNRVDAVDNSVVKANANISRSTGVDLNHVESLELDDLIEAVGDVPDDFMLNLFPYQRVGALAAATGRTFIADAPGVGKTRTALAAAEVIGWERLLLVVPPVVLTHWMRQARDAEMALEMPIQRGAKNVEVDPEERWIMVKKPGLKDRGTPVRGILITADSLLASRAELVAQVASWHPEILIFDESHRAKTWDSTRSKVMRQVAARIRGEGGRCMCLTGTPMPSGNHAELAAQLDITGHLDTVFGGYRAYMETYCRKNSFNQWESRANTREDLGRKLYDYVMIRRKKRDVLKDLPSCMVVPMVVDVDIREFHDAHQKVLEKIDKWIDKCIEKTGILPDDEEITAWANSRLDTISPMRVAAGIAKLPAAIDFITEWVSTGKSEAKYAPKTWDNPLLVWVHHHDVIDALVPMLKAKLKGGFAVLDGTTPGNVKDQAIDDFQAGKLGVLVCGITAISVGVTLTRGSDMLYIESDWVPSNMEQSLGRQDRFGQTNPVIARIMVSPGTLDERLQHILKVKSQNVDATLGKEEGGPQFYVDMDHTGERGAASVGEIVTSLVHECIDNRKARR